MIRAEIMRRFLADLSESSPHCKNSRLFYANKFLDFAEENPEEWNKELVKRFLDKLKEPPHPYAPGTVRYIYGIVKRVFDAAKAVHEAEKNKLIAHVDPTDPIAVAQVLKAQALPGPNWDFGKRSAPRVHSKDMAKPAATLEQIGAMVTAAQKMGELRQLISV